VTPPADIPVLFITSVQCSRIKAACSVLVAGCVDDDCYGKKMHLVVEFGAFLVHDIVFQHVLVLHWGLVIELGDMFFRKDWFNMGDSVFGERTFDEFDSTVEDFFDILV
jgi:hypothetical protein